MLVKVASAAEILYSKWQNFDIKTVTLGTRTKSFGLTVDNIKSGDKLAQTILR